MSLTPIDLSTAFDTVDHQILLQTLRDKFGICDVALDWFDNYLHPWSFRVLINKSYSHEVHLTYSVPQGSAAGANIFNLYCSILQEVVPKDLQLSGFADDHSICKEFDVNNRQEELQVQDKIEQCMLTIKSWMDGVHLKMNPNKTEFIYFGNPVQLRKCTTNSINVDSDLILRSTEICYLGAWLDSSLNCKANVTKKCAVAMANLQRIKSIHHLLDANTTASLCISLCMSHIDYTNALLYGLPDSTINKMQQVWNMCAKLALRKQRWDSPK